MALTLHALLAKGYFPKELPPPFTTTSYADALATPGVTIPAAISTGAQVESRMCTHNLVRTGGLRRLLGIPNPIQYYRLAQHVLANWPALQALTQSSPYSLTRPVEGTADRAISPEHSLGERVDRRVALRAKGKFILTADVSRFFPSIYTHSVPWAILGKAVAKAAYESGALRNTWQDKLDVLARSCNSRQTVGIPIGPDTSRLLAEVILARIDSELANRHKKLSGIRYIDDYEFVLYSRSEAETVLADLQALLGHFELALNPAKTRISELPCELEPRWTSEIRGFQFRNGSAGTQRKDLAAYFGSAFEHNLNTPEEGLLKYTIGRLRGVDVFQVNWKFLEALFNQVILVEPACIPQVCEQVIHYKGLRYPVDKALWSTTLNNIVSEQLPLGNASEAAWAMWLMRILRIRLHQRSAKAVGNCDDSIAAMMGYGLASVNLAATQHLSPLRQFAGPQCLKEEQWLLCYEGNHQGWFGGPPGGCLSGTHLFDYLESRGVSFFDINVPITVPPRSATGPIPMGGGGGSE